jgi:hypothetical protein
LTWLRGWHLNPRSLRRGIMSRIVTGQSSYKIHRLLFCFLSKSSSFRASERFISSLCHTNLRGPCCGSIWNHQNCVD